MANFVISPQLSCEGRVKRPTTGAGSQRVESAFLLMGRRGRNRNLLYVRLAFLAIVLIAAVGFHARGSTLVDLRAVGLVVVVLVLGAGWMARRRGGM
jgi:hypothetical protein